MKKISLMGYVFLFFIVLFSNDAKALTINPELFEIGKGMQLYWGIPFAGMLLSIALFPLFAPHFWEKHFGRIALLWALLFMIPFGAIFSPGLAFHLSLEVLLEEYIPFILLLFSLYTITGGIHISGRFAGTPFFNTCFLAIGTFLASFIGTTGASMLLIRPLLRANSWRKHKVHTVVFFIFLVSNMGGSLTPIGDPPLFLGFILGVGFFWTTIHMFLPFLLVCSILLFVYFLLETYFFKRDHDYEDKHAEDEPHFAFEGRRNVTLLLFVILAVFLSGQLKNGYELTFLGVHLPLNTVLLNIVLLLLTLVSHLRTPAYIKQRNHFTWHPMKEVMLLFIGIFVTIIPMILMLKTGLEGSFKSLVQMSFHSDGTPNNSLFFWLTGILSSFLDNAPTYLVFFNLAGGDPDVLMTTLSTTLVAISTGAVFMGANSYVGNAPNMMVKSIAESRGVKMPSFFGYMIWVALINIPLFVLVSWVFF